jgi:NOL1/NOP2/sun family putative RNA methylase
MEARVKQFLDRYAQLGEKVPQAVTLRQSLRVNTLRATVKQVLERLGEHNVKLEKIPWLKHGYAVEQSAFSLGACTEFLHGYFYLQEAAAQIPAEILAPKSGEFVLDCCAAPGGKTTQIAQLMQNKGAVIALEKKPHRILSLRNNLERCGVSNTAAYHLDAVRADRLGLRFDKVLVDAPCSGNYAGDKDWFAKRTLDDIKKSAQFQKSILKAALGVLKPGGTLVYSTCTLEPEENELNMQWLLGAFDVKLEPVSISIGDPGLTNVFGRELDKSIASCRRFWPHKTGTEGFFVAKVRKL